ncbi:hypothetical protein CW712_05475 [Candidatus Bathyarchaeota archaeon]|nr:MAG: hypothetical protein CW712_05475 [Candidatus Bathyarchaeota archaeon]
MNRWIPTGCSSLDRALGGGLPPGGVCLLYGEAETGKSALATQCAVNCARIGYKTLYVDSDGTFIPERLAQIAFNDFREVSDFIILARPSTFDEQITLVDNLEKYVSKRFGLIVLDTVTSLYRSELLNQKETFHLNRELNRQVATLVEIARTLRLSVLLVGQVRSIINEAEIAPVATRVLKFWCDTVVCLSRTGRQGVVKASIEKVNRKDAKIFSYLIIKEDGVHDYSK